MLVLEHAKGPVGDPGHCVVLNPVMSERWKQLLSGCPFTQKQGRIKSLGWFYDSHPDPDSSSLCVCVCVCACAYAYAWEGNWERPFRCTVQWRMIDSFLISVAERAAGLAVWGPERSRGPVASVNQGILLLHRCYDQCFSNKGPHDFFHLRSPLLFWFTFKAIPAQNSRHT